MQMIAIEQYIHVVLFIMVSKVVVNVVYVCGQSPNVWPFKGKPSVEQYFHVVLFIMLYKVIVTYSSI